MSDEEEFVARLQLKWQPDGSDWVLLCIAAGEWTA